MVGNSRVFEGANPFSLPAAWKVGSELGGIKGEVKESKKNPLEWDILVGQWRVSNRGGFLWSGKFQL